MKSRRLLPIVLAGLCSVVAIPQVRAGGIDHRPPFDDSGIWSRDVQLGLIYTMLATEGGIALWEGGDTRLGKTAWQAIDSTVFAGLAATAGKFVFSRVRPEDANDPNLWFQGSGNESFPSGEVTVVSSIVTPFVLEYGKDHPWVYALEILPAYDAVARVKTWGHWQTDVIAGFALGTTVGYFMHKREMPVILSVLPGGFRVGFSKRW